MTKCFYCSLPIQSGEVKVLIEESPWCVFCFLKTSDASDFDKDQARKQVGAVQEAMKSFSFERKK